MAARGGPGVGGEHICLYRKVALTTDSPLHARLLAHLAGELQNLDAIVETADAADERDSAAVGDAHDTLARTPLDVRVDHRLCVVFANGGPHIEARADLADDGTLSSAVIVAVWEDEPIARSAPPGCAAYRALEHFAEMLPDPSISGPTSAA